jgi:DNA-directed RNA polymerase subunit omega
MARITVEDCLLNVENRFALVMASVKRTKQLYAGADPLVECENKAIICSLREIADSSIKAINAPTVPESQKVERLVPVTLKDPDD